MFKDMLGSGESLFMDTVALDYDYIPKLVPFREKEQHYVADCIKPLFMKRSGKNVLVHGPPGVGKTVAIKHLLRELEEETDEILPFYINCWQKNTTFKIMAELCELLDYKFTHNKKTEELFRIVRDNVNKKSAVFVFDEIDKVEDVGFLYSILEEVYRRSIVLITNYKEWAIDLDDRIKSRMMLEMVEFKQYSKTETKGILKQRLGYAFVKGVWDDDAFDVVADKAYELGDIRRGLYLLREGGNAAESRASKRITKEDVQSAIAKMTEFSTKKDSELDEDARFILSLIKKHTGKRIGELFAIYQKEGGKAVYKTFQRKVKKLSDNRFIQTKKIVGGTEGSTTILSADTSKKITDF